MTSTALEQPNESDAASRQNLGPPLNKSVTIYLLLRISDF